MQTQITNPLQQQLLVVVLGMHRSGTSAITRGLQTIGVNLGDHLQPAIEGVNDKGFWEDIDIVRLNTEMLNSIDFEWHCVSPIQSHDIDLLCAKGYLLRSVELLRKKQSLTPCFGFKDPRTAKLLPFWQKAFAAGGFNVRFVMAIRNPLSVAKSLAKRDGFEPTKSYLLWADHVITSLAHTTAGELMVVDYDYLLQNPEQEIRRVAKFLDAEVHSAELEIYKSEFIDNTLRHSVYQPTDLLIDDDAPPIVQELYSALRALATNGISQENLDLPLQIASWEGEYIRSIAALRLIDKKFKSIAELTGELAEELINKTAKHEKHVQELALRDITLGQRETEILGLHHKIQQLEHSQQEMEHSRQEMELAHKRLENSRQEIELANKQLENSRQEIEEARQRLEYALTATRNSTSWKITAPIRAVGLLAARLKRPYPIEGRAFNALRALLRAAPLPLSLKNRLRFLVLMRSGLFADRQTALWDESAEDVPDSERPDAGYAAMKRRIELFFAEEQAKRAPSPAPMISLADKDLAQVAAKIAFPANPQPRVSIIVPVYGNAQLTLECLASIQRAAGTTDYEIIVADDASPDRTAELLALVRGIKVQRNPQNLGFLRNCNAALPLATGEYVLYLNNDVQVKTGWLDGLLDVFATYPDAGAAGPKIVYPSGYLQEAGVALKYDASADMVGLNDDPAAARYEYARPVDYCSGACLIVRRDLLVSLGGFSDEFAPAYCEDADLCLRIIQQGYKIYYTPASIIMHHLSKTTAAEGEAKKLRQVSTNLVKLHQRWAPMLDRLSSVKVIAFYLPQFHPIPENDQWWGKDFTEWTNVRKAQPNFVGHNQPRIPADLGYYDLRDEEVMVAQAELARRYGIDGFCFYYYWFGGKRLLEKPIEHMLETGKPAFPYCLCWANENWSRRWDGRDNEVLIGQQHSPEDDRAVILDLIRHFRSPSYIRIDGRPHLVVYRVDLFPDFLATSKLWREVCREQGIGEIYLSMVESHDLVHKDTHPSVYGCDAAIEFAPLNMAVPAQPSGEILNPEFQGGIGDYRETALRYCTRPLPRYTRFRGAMPGWDNTARRQDNGFCFEHANPDIFQAWLEHILHQTRQQHHGDERMVFVNAWNEWAEGAYLEPDEKFGHAFLEAVKNAKEAERLIGKGRS